MQNCRPDRYFCIHTSAFCILRFSYTARTKEGEELRGTVDAVDRSTAEEVLAARGYVLLTLREQRIGGQLIGLLAELQRPRAREVVVFLRQFSVMVTAQVPIVRALRSIARSTVQPALRAIIFDLVRDV